MPSNFGDLPRVVLLMQCGLAGLTVQRDFMRFCWEWAYTTLCRRLVVLGDVVYLPANLASGDGPSRRLEGKGVRAARNLEHPLPSDLN